MNELVRMRLIDIESIEIILRIFEKLGEDSLLWIDTNARHHMRRKIRYTFKTK
jgi:hypothetical protein